MPISQMICKTKTEIAKKIISLTNSIFMTKSFQNNTDKEVLKKEEPKVQQSKAC